MDKKRTAAISIPCFALISNIIRRSLREISDGNADGNSLEKNVSISSG